MGTALSDKQKETVDTILQMNRDYDGTANSISKYDLWKTFSNKGEHLKERMWTTGTWMITAMGAILAILFKNGTIKFQTAFPQILILNQATVLFLAGIGILFSAYSLIIIQEFWRRIKRNQMRADYLKGGCKESPAEAKRSANEIRLVRIITGLLIIFALIFVAGIFL